MRSSLFHISFWSNPWILVAGAGMIALQVAAVYVPFLQAALRTVPLGVYDWGLIVAVALPVIAIGEAYKWVVKRFD
mgnify:FL=1